MKKHGFHLCWLRLTGEGVENAEVNFSPGLNVISGPSNTGKSFIFVCIDFMLGNKRSPKIPELLGYDTVYLAIIDHSGQRILLERKLNGGDFRVFKVLDERWSQLSEPMILKGLHDAQKTNNISRYLLSLCGSDGVNILTNKSGNHRMVSFRNYINFVTVSEKEIIKENSPVYPSDSPIQKTPELSLFSYFLSGKDVGEVIALEDIKLSKAKWAGQTEVYSQLIKSIESELSELGSDNNNLDIEISNSVAEIENILSGIAANDEEINRVMADRKLAWESRQKILSRMAVIDQLIVRFDLLKKHYNSDLERLLFISEGDFLLSQLGSPHCPYCGELVEDHTAEKLENEQKNTSNIQEAALIESLKIQKNLKGLRLSLDDLNEEKAGLIKEVEQRRIQIEESSALLEGKLQPLSVSNKNILASLIETNGQLRSKLDMRGRLQSYRNALADLGSEPKRIKEDSISVVLDDGPKRVFLNTFADVLNSWNYRVNVVEMNQEEDIVVDGVARREQGKGVQAILYAAFIVALMENCRKNDFPHTSFVILDSPLTSFKAADNYEVEADVQRGFYESLSQIDPELQILVLENKDPDNDLAESMNYIRFTKNSENGRYGFIPLAKSTL